MAKFYKAIEGTETFEEYGKELIPSWKVATPGFPRNEIEWTEAEDIAAAIREYEDDMDLYAALCEMADMEEKWENAGDGWGDIADAAADKLGVEI